MPRANLIIPAALCLGLAACHGKPKPPTGQVAAVVNGHEITVRQINAELSDTHTSDPKQLKIAQQRALQTIMIRTLLADKAKSEKLDKGPDYSLEEERLSQGLLARLYQKQLASAVPTPSDEEAQSYMDAHPNLFSERKVFTVDQLRMRAPLPPNVVKALVPMTTLEQAGSLLRANGILFQRSPLEIDSVGLDPRLAEAFAKIGPGDMLIVPQGELVTLNAVQNTRVQPFTGPNAVTYARNLLHEQSIQEAEGRQLRALVQSAAPRTAYNPAYTPTSNPKPPPTR